MAVTAAALPMPAAAQAYADPFLFRSAVLGNAAEAGALGPSDFRGGVELLLSDNASFRLAVDSDVRREPNGPRIESALKFALSDEGYVTGFSIPLAVYPSAGFDYYSVKTEAEDLAVSSGLFFSHDFNVYDPVWLELGLGPRVYFFTDESELLVDVRLNAKVSMALPRIVDFIDPHFVVVELNVHRGLIEEDLGIDEFDVSVIGALGYRANVEPFYGGLAVHFPIAEEAPEDGEFGVGVLFNLGVEFYGAGDEGSSY
jgi:hypothetical protein